MKLLIEPVGGADLLFVVRNEAEQEVFLVANAGSASTMRVMDPDAQCVATIRRVGFLDFAVYDIRTMDGGSARLMQSFSAGAPVFAMLKKPWSFRGDFVARSFEILGEWDEVLLTHGRCWEGRAKRFAVEIHSREGLLLLCTVLAMDSMPDSGAQSAVLKQGI